MAEVHNPPPLPPTARAGGRGARRSGGADPRRRRGAALSRRCWRFGACRWPNTTPVGGDAPGPIGPRAAVTSEASWDVGQGEHLQISSPRHVESLEDADVLLTLAATQ